MKQKACHSEAISSNLLTQEAAILSPDISLAIIAGEVPLPKPGADPILEGLKFLQKYFNYYPFNIDDESHNNALQFTLQFIENLVNEQNTNMDLYQIAFKTLSSIIKKIREHDRVLTIAQFFETYITNCDPTIIFALKALSVWLSSKTITHLLVDKDLLTIFIKLLVQRNEQIEKGVLECIESIYHTKICYDFKHINFLTAFIHFASLRFNERTNNIIPFLKVLNNLTQLGNNLNKITCDLIYEEEIYIDLNNFLEIEYDKNTKPIIVLSLKIWISLIQHIPQSIGKINFPFLFNLMQIEDNDILEHAINTISTMVCINKETIPTLLAMGLLDALKHLIDNAGANSHKTILHLLHILVFCKNPELCQALIQMEIISQMMDIMGNIKEIPQLKFGLDIIEELLNEDSELEVNVHDYILEVGGEDLLGTLAENENTIVSTKANSILETYFSEE